jgi:hypothetical protein
MPLTMAQGMADIGWINQSDIIFGNPWDLQNMRLTFREPTHYKAGVVGVGGGPAPPQITGSSRPSSRDYFFNWGAFYAGYLWVSGYGSDSRAEFTSPGAFLQLPQNTGFKKDEQSTVDNAQKLALELSDPTNGKKKCDEALKKLSNGKISSLNSLVKQYITSGTGQNIFDGRKVSAGSYGINNTSVPGFVLGTGTSKATTYLNSGFFNFIGFGGAQAKAIVLLHEAVHHFGGLRDTDFDPGKKPNQGTGSRNITNAIIDNCYPALKETFKGLHL